MRIDRNSLSGNRLRRNLQRLAVGTATSSTEVNSTGGIINTSTGIALGPPAPYLPLSAGSTEQLTGALYLQPTAGAYYDSIAEISADGNGQLCLTAGASDEASIYEVTPFALTTSGTTPIIFHEISATYALSTSAPTYDLFLNPTVTTTGSGSTATIFNLAGGANLTNLSGAWTIDSLGNFKGTGYLTSIFATHSAATTAYSTSAGVFTGGGNTPYPISLTTGPATYNLGAYCTLRSTTTDTLKLTAIYTDELGTGRSTDLIPMNNAGSAIMTTAGAYLYPQVSIRTSTSTHFTVASFFPTGGGSILYDVGVTAVRIL